MPGNTNGNPQGQTIIGTEEDDVLRGTNQDDIIRGRFGDDVIDAKGGDDDVSGGRDDDTIYGGNGDDTIFGDEQFIGGGGSDKAFGGRGNDEINLDGGADFADGGPGNDTIFVNSAVAGIPLILPDGQDVVQFEYAGSGQSFGHDTINEVQGEDVFVFLDKTGKTESLEDLADQTRLVDIGEDAYRIEWLKGDQSVTIHFADIIVGQLPDPGPQPDVDNFTTLEDLAEIVEFRFDFDFA